MSTTSTLPTRWANTPWPLLNAPQEATTSHYAVHIATDMVHVHNIFLRALNSIILQSPYVVKPGDIADLLFYTKTVVITIDAHHFGEEEYLFPALAAYTNNQDIMSVNQAQHAAFHAGLSCLGEYCKSTSPAEYSYTTFKGLIDAFAPSLYEHLRDEIPTMLALKVYPSDELKRMWVQAEKHITDVGSYDEMFPLAFGCMDRGFEGGKHKFPPAPWWVAWVVQYWFARRHQSVWRFNPCDMWRMPRPLKFLPTDMDGELDT